MVLYKDTHREKDSSKRTPALTKSMNMNIWVVGTSNQLFITCSYIETNFQKKKVVRAKTPLFEIGPFCAPHCICFNTDFWQSSFIRKCCVFHCSTFH